MRDHVDRVGSRLRALTARRAGGTGAAPTLVLPDVPAGTQLLLGRSRSADVRFLEPTVSRRHAALQRVANGWLIADRASTHGTYVNGRRVDAAILRDGDELRLGLTTRMIVRS
jgi:pSer/pThr/pTyr-binding forkhead associated (FHA) protein